MERFVVCRPRSGLNDNLNQIEKCWRYCERTGRTLVVDTSRSGGFGLPFGNFFSCLKTSRQVVLSPSSYFLEQLNALPAFPACLAGRLDSYLCFYSRSDRHYLDHDTGTPVTFDFEASYDEPVLVHEQSGGGRNSLHCLARLRLTDDFLRDVISRLAPLGNGPYCSVVVRNGSDYQTDYRALFARIHEPLVGRKLLVASDDHEVIAYARKTLTGIKVVTLPHFTSTNGMPVAEFARMLNASDRYKMDLKGLSDLIGIAAGEKVFVSELTETAPVRYSGFTLLCFDLHKNKHVLQRLLGTAPKQAPGAPPARQ